MTRPLQNCRSSPGRKCNLSISIIRPPAARVYPTNGSDASSLADARQRPAVNPLSARARKKSRKIKEETARIIEDTSDFFPVVATETARSLSLRFTWSFAYSGRIIDMLASRGDLAVPLARRGIFAGARNVQTQKDHRDRRDYRGAGSGIATLESKYPALKIAAKRIIARLKSAAR